MTKEPDEAMVERVAFALWTKFPCDDAPTSWDELDEEEKRISLALARAAIEAYEAAIRSQP